MTGPQWVTTIAGAVGALAGLGALLNAFFGRSKTRAEAAQVITGTAVTWMNEFEEDAKAARRDAKAVREEMRSVRTEARALAEELHQLRTAILQPGITIDALRSLVGAGGRPGL